MKGEICKLKRGDAVTLLHERKDIPSGTKGYIIYVFPYEECESGFMVTSNFIKEPLDSHWYIKIKEDIFYTEKEVKVLAEEAWNITEFPGIAFDGWWEQNKKK